MAKRTRNPLRRSRGLLLTASALLVACASGQLSDAERVWCKANETAVASAAMTLSLPHPDGFMSWKVWGEEAVAADAMKIDGWDSLLQAADLPNRDRACKAAYGAR